MACSLDLSHRLNLKIYAQFVLSLTSFIAVRFAYYRCFSKPNETKQKQKPVLKEMNSKFRNKTLFVCVSG